MSSMKRLIQFESLDINSFEISQWSLPIHNHNYYEIIFITKGTGKHLLNGCSENYSSGCLYLLSPDDYHEFCIEEKTRFIYLKFTYEYFKKHYSTSKYNLWYKEMGDLLQSIRVVNGNLILDREDILLTGSLTEWILKKSKRKDHYDQLLIFDMISMLFTIIKRNVLKNKLPDVKNNGKTTGIEHILYYIQMNIYNPEKLTLKYMANQFFYSPNYLGILFKNKMNTTLRDYIAKYKMNLIRQRLMNSNCSLQTLTNEFGFVDESHFNKYFKKHEGTNPSALKKRN